MANFTEQNEYPASVEKYELNTPVQGGDETASSNLPLKRLVNRTNWLKIAYDALKAAYDAFVVSIPTNYYNKTQTDSQISTAIANLVNSSPATLDTLGEIALALGNDPNLATTLLNAIATETSARTSAVSAEAGDRTAADAALDARLDALEAITDGSVESVIGGTFIRYNLRKIGKVVVFTGILTKATGNADGAASQICTLPVGFRPFTDIDFPMTYFSNVIDESVIGWINVNGRFYVSASTAADVVFNATWIIS